MIDRFIPLLNTAKPFLSNSELDFWFSLIDAQNSPSTKVWEREGTNDFLKRFITDIEREEYKHRNSLSEWRDQLLRGVQIVQEKHSECDNAYDIYTYSFSELEKTELKKAGIKYEGLSPRLLHIAPFMLAYCEGLIDRKQQRQLMTDKYTEQELRDAWRVILNSPNLHDYWKVYHRMFKNKTLFPNWDLLADDELLIQIVMALDEFQRREYKSGKKGACVLWEKELEKTLTILNEKTVSYSDYVHSHSESDLSIEKDTELGKLSDVEIKILQTAGVIGKEETSQGSYNLSYLLHKSELFLAYCNGLLYQIRKEQDSPEAELKKTVDRLIHFNKVGKYLSGGVNPISIEADRLRKDIGYKETIFGMVEHQELPWESSPREIAEWKKGHGFQIDNQGYIIFDGTPRKFLEMYLKESWCPSLSVLATNVKTLRRGKYSLKTEDSWIKAKKPVRKRKKHKSTGQWDNKTQME